MLSLFNSSFGKGSREFKIVQAKRGGKNLPKLPEGPFFSTSPRGAAGKMNTKTCYKNKIKGEATVYITLREVTPGSKEKLYTYMTKRIRLEEPLELTGRTVKFDVKVYSTNPGSKSRSKSGSKSRSKSPKSKRTGLGGMWDSLTSALS